METPLAAQVRAYCEREGCTVEDLADRAGVTKQALYAAMGRGLCGRHVAARIYDATGGAVGLHALLGVPEATGHKRRRRPA